MRSARRPIGGRRPLRMTRISIGCIMGVVVRLLYWLNKLSSNLIIFFMLKKKMFISYIEKS